MYSCGTMRSPRESIDREGGWGSSRREEALAKGAETRASEERGAKWRGWVGGGELRRQGDECGRGAPGRDAWEEEGRTVSSMGDHS